MKKPQKDINDLLEEISVLAPGQWENENSPTLGEWWVVCDNGGIRAYFGNEVDAFNYRLSLINAYFNPMKVRS